MANNASRSACEAVRQSVEAGDIEGAMATCNSVSATVLEVRFLAADQEVTFTLKAAEGIIN